MRRIRSAEQRSDLLVEAGEREARGGKAEEQKQKKNETSVESLTSLDPELEPRLTEATRCSLRPLGEVEGEEDENDEADGGDEEAGAGGTESAEADWPSGVLSGSGSPSSGAPAAAAGAVSGSRGEGSRGISGLGGDERRTKLGRGGPEARRRSAASDSADRECQCRGREQPAGRGDALGGKLGEEAGEALLLLLVWGIHLEQAREAASRVAGGQRAVPRLADGAHGRKQSPPERHGHNCGHMRVRPRCKVHLQGCQAPPGRPEQRPEAAAARSDPRSSTSRNSN